MSVLRPSLLALASLGLLSACGGGGGDGGGPILVPSSAVELTSANYAAAAESSLQAAAFGFEASPTGGGLQGAPAAALRVGGDALKRATAAGVRPLAVSTVEVPCDFGGRLVLTLNDANNNNAYDAGDSVTVDAQACRNLTETLNGRIAMALRELSGVYGEGAYSARLELTLSAFSVTAPNGDSAGASGALVATERVDASGLATNGLQVNMLTISGSEAGQAYSHTLSNFGASALEEPLRNPPRRTTLFAGQLDSTRLGGKSLRFETTPSFVALGNEPYPSSGSMMAYGANNGRVRVTALSASQVRFELDANGDGSYEATVTKLWSEVL